MTDCCTNTERRAILGKGWQWIKLWATGVILLPFLRFINYTIPPQPQIFQINKLLKPGGFIIEPTFIIFDLKPGPIAVSRKCTHLGCRLNFHELENMLICPCHQSKFDKNGKRLAGPAKNNLPVYDVEVLEDDSNVSYRVTIV